MDAKFFEQSSASRQRRYIWESLALLLEEGKTLGQPQLMGMNGTEGAFIQLPDVECDAVIVENRTEDTDFNVRRGGSGTVYYLVKRGTSQKIDVSANANELYIRNATANAEATAYLHFVGEEV